MVVCKFFQQGSCRFGQNCRFEHAYGSKYSYHATQPASQQSQPVGVSDEQLAKQVQADVQAVLKGNQWILSCYAPFKKSVPGLNDLSPEEARLFMYESKSNNTMSAAINYMDQIVATTRSKYEQLLQPTPNIMMTLRSLYNGEAVSSPFTDQTASNSFASSTASSIFRGAVNNVSGFGQTNANTNNSIFGQNNNLFPQSNDPFPKSIFAQASQSAFGSPNAQQNVFASPNAHQSAGAFGQNTDNAKSIFAQATQNVFGQANPVNPPNIFATAQNTFFNQQSSQNNADPFGQKPSDPFGQSQNDPSSTNVFGQNTNSFQNSQGGNIFQTANQSPSNIFGAAANGQQCDDSIYSKPEDLTPEMIEAYKSEQFTLGFIPELPPPKELCI